MKLTPYTLLHPLTRKFRDNSGGGEREETTEELFLRRMNGGDLRALSGARNDTEKALMLIQRLANLEVKQVDLLDAEDIEALGGIIASFAPGGQTTGKPD